MASGEAESAVAAAAATAAAEAEAADSSSSGGGGGGVYTKLRQTDFTPGTGNALQAAVASALGLQSLDGVPNFVAAPEGYEESIRSFLAKRSLEFQKVKLTESGALPEETRAMAAGRLCVVRGTSPRGDFGHVVVGQTSTDGASLELVHDPHPDDTMLKPPLVWAAFFPETAKAAAATGEAADAEVKGDE